MTEINFALSFAVIVICAVVVIFIVVHILGVIGIGEGTPWTISKNDRKIEKEAKWD